MEKFRQQTRETYDASGEKIAERFDSIKPRIRDIERTFAFVEKENPSVLEIGFGSGRDAQEILKKTKNYIGIDYSQKFLEIAKAKNPEGNFVLADAETYEFPQNLDAIFSFASLLHSDKEAVGNILNKAHVALVPGGVFFINLKYGPYHDETITDEWGTRTFYFYTPEDIKELAEGTFTVVHELTYETKGLSHVKWFDMILQK